MAGIKSNEKDKKRTTENGATTQQQDQQLQQDQVQTTEPNNERRARPPLARSPLAFPSLAPLLSNPSLAASLTLPSEQRGSHNEDLQRLIDSYTGGDVGYLIEWFEQVNEDLEKIRRELDVVQKRLRDNDGSA